MTTLFKPDYDQAIIRPSANFELRQDAVKPQFIILHYTGMASAEEAERRLACQQSKVSAHYVVREDGCIVQMVEEAMRAWHAGDSCWQGMTDVNSHSIGIELVNPGPLKDFPPFPDGQITSLIALCQDIMKRHGIAAQNVLGHSDIAPERKIDPGEVFPWPILAQAGVGHFVEPTPICQGKTCMTRGEIGRPVEAYQSLLALYGYNIAISGVFDDRTEIVTTAFQRHFRVESICGRADFSTLDTLHRLLSALDVCA